MIAGEGHTKDFLKILYWYQNLGRHLCLVFKVRRTLLDGNHVIATAKHFMGDGGTFEGVDQGNTRISETGLREIHGYPYFDALDACAQTVMASFNSWNGKKLHGYKNY